MMSRDLSSFWNPFRFSFSVGFSFLCGLFNAYAFAMSRSFAREVQLAISV